jgi:hypothetical protein
MKWTDGAALVLVCGLLMTGVQAFDHGFSKTSPKTKWFEKQLIPPSYYVSCCGKADAYPVDRYERLPSGDYKVWVAEGYDVPYPDGTKRAPWDTAKPIIVPKESVNREEDDLDNPTEYSWLYFIPAEKLDANGKQIPADHPSVIYCFIRHPQGF